MIYSDELDIDFDWQPDLDAEAVVLETIDLMSNKSNFLRHFKSTYLLIDKEYQVRLVRWFQFFNEHYFKNPSLIHLTYYVLLDYSKKNELFRTQTQYEFELSLKFYSHLFSSNTIVLIDDELYCEKLLSISLIYAKYPGMQSRSFKKALKELPLHSTTGHFVNLFSLLMVKYQSPVCLLRNIEKLDLMEVDILMYYLSGHNIKHHPSLDFKISNKEQKIMFFEVPMDIELTDQVLKKHAAIAKVMAGCRTPWAISEFFKHNKIFNYRIDDFLDDILFWIKAYNLITESINPFFHMGVREFLDYLEHKKRVHGKAYNLKGVTSTSITNAVQEWHQVVSKHIDYDLMKKTWLGTQKESFEMLADGAKYEFSEIRDGKTLFAESNMMKHCVFSYVDNCEKGICSIWSLKKIKNTIFKNLLTIEIQNNKIVQVAGQHNRVPLPNELELIDYWAKENDFKFDRNVF